MEDANQQIRKLEAENLNLRFEVFDLKRKQKDLSNQLEKSKLQNNSGRNDSYPSSPYLPSLDSKIFDSETRSSGRQLQTANEDHNLSGFCLKSTNSDQFPRLSEDDIQAPNTPKGFTKIPQLQQFGRSQSFAEIENPPSLPRGNSF